MARVAKTGRRAWVLAILCVVLAIVVLAVAGCGGGSGPNGAASTSSLSSTTTAAVTPSMSTISLPASLTAADRAFLLALTKSVQGHTQEILDLGAFILTYRLATAADVARAEENVKKVSEWVDEVKAMTPSDGLRDVHRVLSQALSEYLDGFRAFVAAVKAKDDAGIKAASAAINEASKKYQMFSHALGSFPK